MFLKNLSVINYFEYLERQPAGLALPAEDIAALGVYSAPATAELLSSHSGLTISSW